MMNEIALWEYCRLRAPEFYTDERTDLRLVADTLQALYEGKMERRKVMINMPHRSGKTRTLVLFTEWVFGRDSDKQFIAASYNEDIAKDFAHNVRDGIGENLTPNLKAVGVGQSLTGCEADISVLDDPIKGAYEANNSKLLDRQWEWFKETMTTRLNPDAIQIVYMTRWCDGDIASRILASKNVDEWLILDLERR